MTTATNDLTALTGDYTFDTTHSRIGFVARHAMVTKVRGSFNEFEGLLSINGAEPGKSTAKVTIKTASIDTRNEQRDGHLRTNDFLDMDNHPEITFVSTGISQVEDTDFEVTGDLTIRGVTQTVTIPLTYDGTATDPFGNVRIGFEGGTSISRKDFGITWNATLETGGVLVSDKIVLEFEISAIKNS